MTARTFINRLLKKNAIGLEKAGRSYRYYPPVSGQERVRAKFERLALSKPRI
ncbi:BlaI/MecI/CopY family transcriptional regulator [Paenibacillus ehimensis]|uniref:BlaI/MecI/CopY family transcriptional regulator n=1 Tax=Paenibacillus ehimensis TaxID=79264 RepID=A0ABT8VDE6_9BACL|nr:BlaI/MecI/CopY family transcriptional regulator [Paenibacillus ehimensis]MDO3679001.1 BlaI/MecI/CopY family transcriptional regulator [Paenibacillus ehimensis]MEC0209960.1 BlaI/MecI/CopY family transcriptional regulator [Paenibacillus ehimensis]